MFENMFNKKLKEKVDKIAKEIFSEESHTYYSLCSSTLVKRLEIEELYSCKIQKRLEALLLHLKLEEHEKDGKIIFEPLKKKKKSDYCDED